MQDESAQYSEAYLMGLLEEARDNLTKGPPTLAIKSLIRQLVQQVEMDEEVKKAPKVKKQPKKESKNDRFTQVAVCPICGLERAGEFMRSGFKCSDCKGERVDPQHNTKTSCIPSTRFPAKFGFVNLWDESGAMDSEPALSPYRSFVHRPLPWTKYSVVLTPSTDASRNQIPVIRLLHNPCIVYNYACGTDRKLNRDFFVQENTHLLGQVDLPAKWIYEQERENGDESPEVTVQHERLRKIVCSSLIALAFLHDKEIVHGDLRPHNFRSDQKHNTKIRFVPFVASGPWSMPAPFCPPEAENVVDVVPTKAMDVYTLGASIAYFAFGPSLAFPTYSHSTPDDLQLIQLIKSCMAADPSNRPSARQALASEYLMAVRSANGIPIEPVLTRVLLRSDDSDEEGFLFNGLARGSSNAATVLTEFFREHGPVFQILSTRTYVTLYSVKSDPRRRRSQSINKNVSFVSTDSMDK